MRKLVVPALPTAAIPDPERGDVLPPGGRIVDWTSHWALMLLREEITVAEPPAEQAEASVADEPAPAAAVEAAHDAPAVEAPEPHPGH